jgi:oligosaccharide repeat unit polymerase
MSVGSIALVICWCVAAWHLKRRITLRISVTSLFFGGLLLLHGLPMLSYLYITGPGTVIYESALQQLDRDEIIDRLQLALALMFLCITLGSFVAEGLLPSWAALLRQLHSRKRSVKIKHVLVSSPATTVFFLLTILVLTAVAVLEAQPGKIFNFYSAGLDAFQKAAVRMESGGSASYVYNLFVSSLGTFVAMVAFTSWRYERGGYLLGLIATALIVILWMAKFATLMKSPPVMFLLQFLLLYMILSGKTLSTKTVVTLVLVLVALSTLIVLVTFQSLDISQVYSFLYYRLFEIPNEVLLEYFAAIPATLPYEWGSGLFGFLRDAKSETDVPTYLAVAAITRGNMESSSNAMFIADAWAQFSWMGVAAFSFLAGAVTRSIDLYAFGRGFTDESAVIVAACSYGVLTMLVTSLPTALLTGGLALIPLLSFFVSGRAGAIFQRLRTVKLAPGSLE